MGRVRRSSSSVTISSWCRSLSETRGNERRVFLVSSDWVWHFNNLNSPLLSAVFSRTPSPSWLRLVPRDWSRSKSGRPWWWSHPPDGLDHLDRGQIRKGERGNCSFIKCYKRIKKYIIYNEWQSHPHKSHCHPLPPAALPLLFYHLSSLDQLWHEKHKRHNIT